jgi:hypothetical protein
VSHRTRVKSVIKHFCQWLIDEKEALKRNPASSIEIKAQQQLAPRVLEPDQRFVLRNLIEKEDNLRGQALFGVTGSFRDFHTLSPEASLSSQSTSLAEMREGRQQSSNDACIASFTANRHTTRSHGAMVLALAYKNPKMIW